VVAVTKGHPPEAAAAAVAAGFADLGENYAQEMLAKVALVPGARWHFVGRLQSNKVRTLAGHVQLWQSIDRRTLVKEVAKRDPGAKVLIQVDLAGTEGRGGALRSDVGALVDFARDSGLDVSGLMGVAAPQTDAAREAFSWMAATAGELGLHEVSMGMSEDLELALESGATMVRIGTALLGPR
jgi:pyridoxal phosphate enzyme (YggS family)